MKMKWLKKALPCVLVLAMCLTVLPLSTPAAETEVVKVAPENVLNVVVVNKEGEPVDGITVNLVDSENRIAAFWYTGSPTIYNSATIRAAGNFRVGKETLEKEIAPYELKRFNGSNSDLSATFSDGETKTLKLEYIGDRDTDLTVPANTLVMDVDPSYSNRSPRHYFQIGNGEKLFFKNIAGYQTYPLAAGDYPSCWLGYDGATGVNDLSISDQPTEYIKVRVKLSALDSKVKDDGTISGGAAGYEFSLKEDTDDRAATFAIVSGNIVSVPVPDENGYIAFYVEKSTRRFSIHTHFSWVVDEHTSGSGGGYSLTHYAYDSKTVTFQAADYPDTGTTAMYVPAGNYTIKLQNVPAAYTAAVTNITVEQSVDVQTVTIVLDDHHIHAPQYIARNEPTCTKDGNIAYWYCAGCSKYFRNEACTAEITEADTVLPKHHTLTAYTAKSPTCTEDGNIAYWYCTACGKYFSDEAAATEVTKESVVLPKGHDLVHHDGKEPTCTDAGWAAYDTCTRCDYTTYEEIPATEHTYGAWKDAGDGKNHTHACACGAEETEAHKWDKGKVTKEPTLTEEGEKLFTCTVCNATKTQTMPVKPASPETGDRGIGLWAVLLVLSAGAVTALVVVDRKKRAC